MRLFPGRTRSKADDSLGQVSRPSDKYKPEATIDEKTKRRGRRQSSSAVIDRVPTAKEYRSFDSDDDNHSKASRYSSQAGDQRDAPTFDDDATNDKYSRVGSSVVDGLPGIDRLWSESMDSCPAQWRSWSQDEFEFRKQAQLDAEFKDAPSDTQEDAIYAKPPSPQVREEQLAKMESKPIEKQTERKENKEVSIPRTESRPATSEKGSKAETRARSKSPGGRRNHHTQRSITTKTEKSRGHQRSKSRSRSKGRRRSTSRSRSKHRSRRKSSSRSRSRSTTGQNSKRHSKSREASSRSRVTSSERSMTTGSTPRKERRRDSSHTPRKERRRDRSHTPRKERHRDSKHNPTKNSLSPRKNSRTPGKKRSTSRTKSTSVERARRSSRTPTKQRSRSKSKSPHSLATRSSNRSTERHHRRSDDDKSRSHRSRTSSSNHSKASAVSSRHQAGRTQRMKHKTAASSRFRLKKPVSISTTHEAHQPVVAPDDYETRKKNPDGVLDSAKANDHGSCMAPIITEERDEVEVITTVINSDDDEDVGSVEDKYLLATRSNDMSQATAATSKATEKVTNKKQDDAATTGGIKSIGATSDAVLNSRSFTVEEKAKESMSNAAVAPSRIQRFLNKFTKDDLDPTPLSSDDNSKMRTRSLIKDDLEAPHDLAKRTVPEFDEYSNYGNTDPQVVQCLRFYYCGGMAAMANVAIEAAECKGGRTDEEIVQLWEENERLSKEPVSPKIEVVLEHNLPSQAVHTPGSSPSDEDGDSLVESDEDLLEAPDIHSPNSKSYVTEVTRRKLRLDDGSLDRLRKDTFRSASSRDSISITSIDVPESMDESDYSSALTPQKKRRFQKWFSKIRHRGGRQHV